ncbi:MAG: tRNA uridine-5-carboxymethylaminomethyl(34) synthesis GTPase MnmE [Hyphomicrobiaceae bacterium]
MSPAATIFALSSGRGRAGVAVLRISGPGAGAVFARMAPPLPKPRFGAFRRIRHPASGEVLDEALALWLPGPKSETGEDMAELHIHGGGAVVRAVLAALATLDGFRMAEPGEFARRAFENGKIDLTGAEGLADLVDAETEAQRRQALRQAGGALAALYDGWRERLLHALALMESVLDFADEPEVGERPLREARALVAALAPELSAHLADGRRGEIVRDGFQVVIAGPPNAGKSSLLNALLKRQAAIVSEEAGTTRDVIEATLELGGLPVVLSDTAGIRDAASTVEQEGVRRAMDRARHADLVLWVTDAADPASAGRHPEVPGRDCLRVLNKADLFSSAPPAGGDAVVVSARTGQGLPGLLAGIEARALARIGETETPAITQARHREQIAACSAALEAYLAGNPGDVELRAEDLRRAASALGRLTGRVDVEDILDRIFSRFCIGK